MNELLETRRFFNASHANDVQEYIQSVREKMSGHGGMRGLSVRMIDGDGVESVRYGLYAETERVRKNFLIAEAKAHQE